MTRWTVGLTLFLALILSVGLFRITYQVDEMEQELRALNKEIIQEQETIHILNAEWSYLNDPDRLRELAERYLSLKEMDGGQLIDFDRIDPNKPHEDPAAEPLPEIHQPVRLDR